VLSASERQELLQLAMAVWPRDSPDRAVQVKRYMAGWLLATRGLLLLEAAAHSMLGGILGSPKSVGVGSWRSVLSQEPCFVLGEEPSGIATIQLDVTALRQLAHKQGVTGNSGGADSSSDEDSGSSDGRDSSSGDCGSSGAGEKQSVSQVSPQHLTMCACNLC
jgi:hypothetical protein